jgi:hypothetical protein
MGDNSRNYKLVFLKFSAKIVEGFIATLPNDPDVDLKEISFSGPNPIAGDDEVKFWAGGSTSIPFFDYHKGEIVWTTHVVGPRNVEDYFVRNFDIWHIGSHFTLDRVDHTQFYSELHPTFFVLEGGSLHLNFAEGNMMKYTPPTVRRQLDDGKWISLPVNVSPYIAREKREWLQLFGYGDKDPSLNYIYLTRFFSNSETKENSLFLDLIKTSLFRELDSPKPSLWQSFRVPCTTDWAARPFGQLITTDMSTGKRRLYIFGANTMLFQNIYTTWVPLKKDGYVDATKSSTLPSNLGTIPIKSHGHKPWSLRVTDLNHRQVLLTWEEKGKPYALFGRIGENGAIPEQDQWKEVALKFEVPIEEDDRQAFAPVVVPDSFE